MRYSQFQKPMLGTPINWAHPLAKGLVACFLMNEGSGNKIYDLSGNRNTGSLVGNTYHLNGLVMDGGGDYVNLSGSTAYLTSATVSAWFIANNPGTDTFLLACTSDWGINTLYAYIRWSSDAILVWSWDSSGPRINLGSPPITAGRLNNITCTNSPSGVILYLNGVRVADNAQICWRIMINGSLIGKYNSDTTCFNGTICSQAIYNRALSAQEVQQLYQTPYAMFEQEPIWNYYVAAAGGLSIPVAMHHYKMMRNN